MKKLKITPIFLLTAYISFAQILDPNFAPTLFRAGSGTTLAIQADQKILIASQSKGFLDDQAVSFMFRLEANGTLDPSFQYPTALSNAPITIKVQADGKILIGGSFKDTSGQYLGNLLRLLPDGRIDSSFTVLKDENFTLRQLEVLPNQKIFILEHATTYISQARLLSRDGSPLPHFRAHTFDESVAAIGVQSNNELLLAGTNLQIGSRTQSVFRLDSTGLLDSIFNPQLSPASDFIVQTMATLTNGVIGVVSGGGSHVSVFDRNGKTTYHLYVPNQNVSFHRHTRESFLVLGKLLNYEAFENGVRYDLRMPGPDNYVSGTAIHGENGIVIVGRFTSVSNLFRAGLARLIIRGWERLIIDTSFTAGLYIPGMVRDILRQNDGKLIVGGNFHRVNGQTTHHITRLLPNGAIDPTFNPSMAGVSNRIYKIRQQSNGSLVIACDGILGGAIDGLNLTNANGYQVHPLGFPYWGSPPSITYLALDQNDKIYAGEGVAYNANGDSGQEFARFSANGILEANYNHLYVNSLRRFNGFTYGKNQKLLLLGVDLRYDNSDTTCFLQLLPSGARDQNFQLNFNKRAVALTALSLDTTFSLLGGVIRNGFTSTSAFLLKLDAAGQIVQAPTLTHTSNNFPGVSELFELPNGRVLVSGSFNRYNNIPVNNHIVIDKNAQLISNFLPEMPADATYSTTANIDGNSMYLGGIFTAPNGAVGLVKVTNLLTSSFNPVSKVKKGKIFPNPSANETLYLELDAKIQSATVQYQILEMGSGKVLEFGRVQNPALQSFDLKALKQGAYVLRLIGADWEESHVFSKVK